jgi:hypothetical protein
MMEKCHQGHPLVYIDGINYSRNVNLLFIRVPHDQDRHLFILMELIIVKLLICYLFEYPKYNRGCTW